MQVAHMNPSSAEQVLALRKAVTLYLDKLCGHKVGTASQSVAMRKEARHAHALQVLHGLIRSDLLLGSTHFVPIKCQAHRCYMAREPAPAAGRLRIVAHGQDREQSRMQTLHS